MKTCKEVIRGWELANLDPETFNLQVVEVSEACKECEYLDRCRFPSNSLRQLAPKKGRLAELGRERIAEGEAVTYYSLTSKKDVRYIQLNEPRHYWATASYIPEEQVPPWILNLGESRHKKTKE